MVSLEKTAIFGRQFGETHLLTKHAIHMSVVSSGTLHHA